MTEQNRAQTPRFSLNAVDRLARARALDRDYEAFLAPGEKFTVQAEADEAYIHAQIVLTSADKSFKLDLEAVIIPQDLTPHQERLEDRVFTDLLFDFLRVQLYEFFRQDRHQRFHLDWRVFPFEGYPIRLRGAVTQPDLIAQADALLESVE